MRAARLHKIISLKLNTYSVNLSVLIYCTITITPLDTNLTLRSSVAFWFIWYLNLNLLASFGS